MTLTDWMVAGPAESRHTLRYLLLALATLVLATSCGNDDVGAVSPVNRSLAAETPGRTYSDIGRQRPADYG